MRKVTGTLLVLSLFFLSFISTEPTPYKFPPLNFFPPMPEESSNPVTVEGARLGRYLFYDPILSSDSSMSCSSCHKQQFAFSDAPYQFSPGRNGELLKRNTMPLFNLAWFPTFFWDGKAASIEEQIFHPVSAPNEMNLQWDAAAKRLSKSKFYSELFSMAFGEQKPDSNLISKSLAQFLRTLISNQSKYDRVLNGKGKFTKDEEEGFVLMNDQTKGDCLHCHTTDADALGTTAKFSNNGLDDLKDPEAFTDLGRGAITGSSADNGKFIIPSLRNIALTAPYMHDGRFNSLQEVLNFYSEGVNSCANIDSKMQYAQRGGVNLSDDEKRKIIAFLLTLTDSGFISNPEFANPFLSH